ncbi:accessory Sec system glycosyltransferase Asp1 [Schleiferilactobacillus harbinensis]|uniref:Accessory Sec system glycosyltransferase Asp1 n=1 Tax=Schleiferilactobacillus harbinensis TaxID=304207 RepID=A0A5P8M6T9_9LACO|nr:accessory Sec system glycosyltransferase Asp1 [Schleiferilactobacillus harbinensis]QFR24179.1 accessory Sec system glycosyltransferase Asp1 [Schleiferilactobacillus harbinensis]
MEQEPVSVILEKVRDMIFAVPQWQINDHDLPNDDFVHLIQLTRGTKLAVTLLMVDEAPGLRYQLNHNQLLGTAWASLFDVIQAIPVRVGVPLSPADVKIPVGSELIYGNGQALIVRGDQQLGTITYHPEGFVWQVIWTLANGERRVDQYDDRGFLSTRTLYAPDNRIKQKEWLDITGQAVMRQTDQITITAGARSRFSQSAYATINDVIGEFLHKQLVAKTGPQQLIMAADRAFSPLVANIPPEVDVHCFVHKLTEANIAPFANTTQSWITDTDTQAEALRKRLRMLPEVKSTAVRVIPPYNTTLSLGRSNELAAVISYWHVNQLPKDDRQIVFNQFLKQLQVDPDKQLIVNADNQKQIDDFQQTALNFAAESQAVSLDSAVFQRIQALLRGDEPPLATPSATQAEITDADEQQAVAPVTEKRQAPGEKALIEQIRLFLTRITYQAQADYEQIVQNLSLARILVDLGSAPDLFMQLAAISAGIPQINRVPTGYVTRETGRIISDWRGLDSALTYYLDSLAHWNQALVANVQLIDRYSENHSLALWQEVLTDGGH